MDLIKKAFELFAAVRAKDWPNIIRLLGELVPIVFGGMTCPPPVPAMAMANSPMAHKSLDALVDEADAACNQLAPKGASAAPAQRGKIIDALKPLIGKLILMLLGIG